MSLSYPASKVVHLVPGNGRQFWRYKRSLPSLIDIFFFFFFSSRRRHTRLVSDWSSDVCSSDLYKVATPAYKVHTTGSPVYLKSLVRHYTPTRELRSSSLQLLEIAPARTAIARRAFSQAAPAVWNSLPYDVRTAETFERFKSSIRTHLYRRAFC